MNGLLAALLSVEGVAALLALAYLWLALRESLWCWVCALLSSVLYCGIFWEARLYMETLLNAFYAVMAVIGWWQWRSGASDSDTLPIQSWPWQRHVLCAAVVLLLATANGWLLAQFTAAFWPFADALIAWGGVLTTWLVVRKVLENWLYWLLLDALAVAIYTERGLYPTALLYALYLVLVVAGYLRWRRVYRDRVSGRPAA